MAVSLNHTIVSARDRRASALFLADVLGLEPPVELGHFAAVRIGETSLDFADTDDSVVPQHYAFLVSEAEFDEIFERIRGRKLAYWADPMKSERNEINKWDDGRGVYFEDPNGHLLEIITRPYGSGGTAAENPHPLIAPRLDEADVSDALSRKRND